MANLRGIGIGGILSSFPNNSAFHYLTLTTEGEIRMRKAVLTIGLALGTLAVGAAAVHAQDEAPEQFLMATYYECDYATEGTADMMMQRLAPVFQKHVDAGHINGFGMSAHVMGGDWRRIVSMSGPRDNILDVWTTLDGEMQEADPVAYAQFNQTCGKGHLDMLWANVAGSAPVVAVQPNQFRLSTYFFCNQAEEASVDTLVTDVIGPEIQKHVDMGHVTSWAWMRHANGGTMRRILTYTAPTVKGLFQMRDAVFDGVGADAARKMFGGSCGNHFEYVWADVDLTP